MPKLRKNKDCFLNDKDTTLDPSRNGGCSPETKLRIGKVAEKIAKGWTRFETTKWMEKEWEISNASMTKYWNAALTLLAKNATDSEYVEEMRKKAIATLDRAIQEEISQGKYKELNGSLDLMSRLMGYNQPQKYEVKADTNIKFTFGDIPQEPEEEAK